MLGPTYPDNIRAIAHAIRAVQELHHKLNRLAAMADLPPDEIHLQWRIWYNQQMYGLMTWREALEHCERQLLQGLPLPWLQEGDDDDGEKVQPD